MSSENSTDTNPSFNQNSSENVIRGSSDSISNSVKRVIAASAETPHTLVEVHYVPLKVIGSGTFGTVYQAKLCESGEFIAIKKVLQDKRFVNRELEIMRALDHCNIVKLLYSFYTDGPNGNIYLNLILEFVPETIFNVIRQHTRIKRVLPINYVRLYIYQLLRSLAYLHSLGICHRDIKPQNLLVDPETGILKVCDLGSAKRIIEGQSNVSYICSRYYRAPELIFGATRYTTRIDIWSTGCVMAELLLGKPLFAGDSAIDQMVEIIKVLGTPTPQDIHEMNPDFKELNFPQLGPHHWEKVFRPRTVSDAVSLISQLLVYAPKSRLTPLQACAHEFFDELRQGPQLLPNGRSLPPLFDFTEHELSIEPDLNPLLLPGTTPSTVESHVSEVHAIQNMVHTAPSAPNVADISV